MTPARDLAPERECPPSHLAAWGPLLQQETDFQGAPLHLCSSMTQAGSVCVQIA